MSEPAAHLSEPSRHRMPRHRSKKVLITGGAGFIGSHTADLLSDAGYEIRILDALVEQVHRGSQRPSYLRSDHELIVGDVCDRHRLRAALAGVSYVYHFASETGVGQSMYELERYYRTNVLGTAVLWEEIQKSRHRIEKFILASSRAVYGEGAWDCPECGRVEVVPRAEASLIDGDWWHRCGSCRERLRIAPTDENVEPRTTSIYGQTKKVQEEISSLMAGTLKIPLVILRYFNVYGERQALSNPYSGLLALFASRASNGRPIFLYEEGHPLRDFVHVADVARANILALEQDTGPVQVLNVGSGQPVSIDVVARLICSAFGVEGNVVRTRRFRLGDVLGCYADLARVQRLLGFEPSMGLEDGIGSLLGWVEAARCEDHSDEAEGALRALGLLRGE